MAGFNILTPPPAFCTVKATPLTLIAVVAMLAPAELVNTSFNPQHVTVGLSIHCIPEPVELNI